MWRVYLAPQNIHSAIVLTLGNKVGVYWRWRRDRLINRNYVHTQTCGNECPFNDVTNNGSVWRKGAGKRGPERWLCGINSNQRACAVSMVIQQICVWSRPQWSRSAPNSVTELYKQTTWIQQTVTKQICNVSIITQQIYKVSIVTKQIYKVSIVTKADL